MDYTHEMSGPRLKLKYRCHKPKGKNPSKAGGNSGIPNRGVLPVGIPRKYRGKTRFK